MKHKMGFLPGEAREKLFKNIQWKNLYGNKTNSDRKGKVKAMTIDQSSSVTRPMKVTIAIAEVIQMVLKNHTQAKDLECRIESTLLSVTLKSGQTKRLLAGEFTEKIRADESMW
ncbi:hypothetical protein PsorP6_003159 [Peronosclerospora sorghi]|uniref:Uncharacterized protein n=1 Tax=Peronosclerospora sorghi TaxID=230839 RepID=A0ACC0VQJ4_9STRA|nr:hypothetical protein PsorP6_003159 [Peronosclerospora sorghi]